MSALDVPVRAPIPNLLRELQPKRGLSCPVIAHNIDVVEYVADRVALMRVGRIGERGASTDVLAAPGQAYTRELVDAAPRLVGLPLADGPLTFLTGVFS